MLVWIGRDDSMAGSPWVVDITQETFQEQVVDRSHERPVVVDYWAPWCGPCRALGPVLEALAIEKNGDFVLAKVNTQDNQDLARAFQISSIPVVFAIRGGKMVDRFEGMLPEAEIRQFIDRLTPSEAETQAATALELEGRDPGAAETAYRQLVAANPDDLAARVGLARVLLHSEGNDAEALSLLAPVEGTDHATEAERLRAVIAVRAAPHTDADLAAAQATVAATPDAAPARLELGRVLAARGQYLPAMDVLLVAAELDKPLGATQVRELMVTIFTILGARSPESDDYRGRLRSLLY